MWDLWWTKWRWGRFSPSTSVSPATHCSTLIYLSSGAGTVGQLVAAVPSGLSLTPPLQTLLFCGPGQQMLVSTDRGSDVRPTSVAGALPEMEG
jgi:hypothetical protein